MNNLKLVNSTSTPLAEYQKIFPQNIPTCFQQDLIETLVTDLDVWIESLTFWAGNDYRPQSVQKILEHYEAAKKDKQNGTTKHSNKQTPGQIIANRPYR